jgi:hypothetical protein
MDGKPIATRRANRNYRHYTVLMDNIKLRVFWVAEESVVEELFIDVYSRDVINSALRWNCGAAVLT